MRTYLGIFNPLIALLIFILCSFAAMKEDKNKPIVPANIIAGGIPTYFFAKGMFVALLFSSSAKFWRTNSAATIARSEPEPEGSEHCVVASAIFDC